MTYDSDSNDSNYEDIYTGNFEVQYGILSRTYLKPLISLT